MVVDPVAAEVFSTQLADARNAECFDTGAEGPTWASVSHGIYLSIGASGVHRSLGVKVSYVQSTTMDSWKPVHLKMMQLGGNKRFQDFLDEHGVPRNIPIREKYQTRAAAWYRENLRAEAEGSETPPPLEKGTGHLLMCDPASPEQLVLDRVFAQAPGATDMTRGGVPARRSGRAGSRRARRCGLSTLVKSGRERMLNASATVPSFAHLSAQICNYLTMMPLEDVEESADGAGDTPRSRSRSRSTSPAPRVGERV